MLRRLTLLATMVLIPALVACTADSADANPCHAIARAYCNLLARCNRVPGGDSVSQCVDAFANAGYLNCSASATAARSCAADLSVIACTSGGVPTSCTGIGFTPSGYNPGASVPNPFDSVGSAAGGSGTGLSLAISVRGTVKSASGSLVPNATVTWSPSVGSPVVTNCDSAGTFRTNLSPGYGVPSAALSVTAANFAPQLMIIPLKPGITTYTLDVTLSPISDQVLNTGASTTVPLTLAGQVAAITIPAGAPMGTHVRVAPITPANSPGAMAAQGGPAGDALASIAMFYIEFANATGGKATAPSGMRVNLPPMNPPVIPNSDPFNAYRMNDQGKWDQAAPLTAPTAMQSVTFDVTQFGFWNADHAFRTACISGKVKAPSGMCGGARLDVSGPDGIHSYDTSGEDGSFCLVGPQGHSAVLNASAGTVTFPMAAGNCSQPSSCQDIGVLPIVETQCQPPSAGSDGMDTSSCDGTYSITAASASTASTLVVTGATGVLKDPGSTDSLTGTVDTGTCTFTLRYTCAPVSATIGLKGGACSIPRTEVTGLDANLNLICSSNGSESCSVVKR